MVIHNPKVAGSSPAPATNSSPISFSNLQSCGGSSEIAKRFEAQTDEAKDLAYSAAQEIKKQQQP
jgi:hypothetical protein